MREILFRGKTKHGEWAEGWFIGATRKAPYDPPKEKTAIISKDLCCYDVIPETVGQYTGLTANDGKKIFEGDIVLNCEEEIQGFIKYDEQDARFVLITVEGEMYDFSTVWNVFFVVIGNIHDNPELLEV